MLKGFISSFIVLITLAVTAGFAQDVRLTGQTKQVVSVGETFTLVYTLNAQGSGFRGPNIQGFDMLSGPNASQSSSIRSVNGSTTISYAFTFTYLLRPL